MSEELKTLYLSLKKNGYWWPLCLSLASIVLLVGFYILDPDGMYLASAVTGCLFAAFVMHVSLTTDALQEKSDQIKDLTDDLCLANHKVEQLKQEIEAQKSVEKLRHKAHSTSECDEKGPTKPRNSRRYPRKQTHNEQSKTEQQS